MVGPLARITLNHDNLSDGAKQLLKGTKLKIPDYSPYMNNVAQAIEILHCIEKSMEIIENLKIKNENVDVTPRAGEGFGVTEAPRGTLYHHYKINEKGIVEWINIITPTAQKLKNIEADVKEFLPQILDKSKEQIIFELEKLIRAYDPCMSCSAHFLDVKFV